MTAVLDRFRLVKRDGVHRVLVLSVPEDNKKLVWEVYETPSTVYVTARNLFEGDVDRIPDMLEAEYIEQIKKKDVFFKIPRTKSFRAVLRICERLRERTAIRVVSNLFFMEAVV